MFITKIEDFLKLDRQLNSVLLAIDYGTRKIGMAISNPERNFVMPLPIVYKNILSEQVASVYNVLEKYCKNKICILGIPPAHESNHHKKVKKFGSELIKKDMKIYLQDESYTSRLANKLMSESKIPIQKLIKKNDSVAALIILEDFLEIYNLMRRNNKKI